MAAKTIGTAAQLQRIRPPVSGRDEYSDIKIPGLRLRVSSAGRMEWSGIARLHGRQQRFDLGAYAESDSGLGLAEARRKWEEWRRQIAVGDDPRPAARAEKARRHDTFGDARDRFMREHVGRNLTKRTHDAYRLMFARPEVRRWEHRPVKSIARSDVIALVNSIAVNAPIAANRTLAHMRKFFNWCAEADLIKSGEPVPTDRVKPPLLKEKARERVLSEAEIRLLWQATEGMPYPDGPFFRLALLTGQRRTEVASIRRCDIDGDQWHQTVNKASRPLCVPLNPLALVTIAACPDLGEFLLSTTGNRPTSNFGRSKARIDARLAELIAALPADHPDNGAFAEGWRIHDLRRSMVTHLRRAGVSRDVCSRLLNHVERGVTAVHYDQYDELPEKTHAMAVWDRLLRQIIESSDARQPPTVIQLRR